MFDPEIASICKKISFLSNGFLLKGTLHLPQENHQGPVVIGSHGLFSTGESPKQIALAEICRQYGIAFFRFDHRGCGESEGDFNQVTSLVARRNDLICAIEMIRSENYAHQKIGLFGSSMGGAVCMAAASLRSDISSLVTVAAPVRIRSQLEAVKAIEKSEKNNLPAPSFYKKNLQFDISKQLSNLRNILIFHGDADEVIPFSNALEIYEKAGEPKKLITQIQGDHRMSLPAHQEEFMKEAGLWFKRSLL